MHCYTHYMKALCLVVLKKNIFYDFPRLWELSVAMETTILIQSVPKRNTINPQPNYGSHQI